MNPKIAAAAAAVTAATVVMLAGCSNPPTHGYVYSLNYNPPSSAYWPGHWYSSCSGTGKYRTCFQEYSPGWTEYFPAEWQIDLCQTPGPPSKSNACGWRDVDEQTYHTVRLGQFWTSVAGAEAGHD
jgi:hypothetical protein